MVAADVADHGVLHRVQILKLVHEDAVPPRLDALHDASIAEKLGGLEDEHVEVDEIAVVEEDAIAVEDVAVAAVLERDAAEAIAREAGEQAAVPAGRNAETFEDDALLPLVDDAEAALEPHAGAKFAQQLGAEGVDRARLDDGGGGA